MNPSPAESCVLCRLGHVLDRKKQGSYLSISLNNWRVIFFLLQGKNFTNFRSKTPYKIF